MSEGKEEELKEIVDALKDAIAELKTALSDLTGPFASIRKEASQSLPKEVKEEKSTAQKSEEPIQKEILMRRNEAANAPHIETQKSEKDLEKVVRALKTLYMLREHVSGEIIEDQISTLKSFGLSDERALEQIKQINALIDKSLKSGIGLEEQIISLYIIARLLDLPDRELEQEFLESVLDKLKKRETKGQ
ncbi:MAG: hypothetical protein QXT69_04645 [Fervidicoccaceae archaeon]